MTQHNVIKKTRKEKLDMEIPEKILFGLSEIPKPGVNFRDSPFGRTHMICPLPKRLLAVAVPKTESQKILRRQNSVGVSSVPIILF
jgi:hypothetical protein